MTAPIPGLILVDGHNWLVRALHAIPETRTALDEPTHAVLGYVRTLLRVLGDPELRGATHAAVVWDAPDGRAARQALYPGYKSQRATDRGAGFASQLGRAKELTEALGVASVEVPGAEADDVIGTLANRTLVAAATGRAGPVDVVIVSTDKDMRQLLVGARITIYSATASPPQGGRWTRAADCRDVPPHLIADWLALGGDAADGLHGVEGIGPKTAADLLRREGCLDDVLYWARREVEVSEGTSVKPARHAARIHAAREHLKLMRRLTGLWDIPAAPPLSQLRRRPVDARRWSKLLMDLEFRALLRELDEEERAP